MNRNFQLNQIFLPNDLKDYWEYNTSMLESSTVSNQGLNALICYDDFYCNNDKLAHTGHVALGVFGLMLTLVGLILNILLIPVMSLVGIRSSATYYMIAMAISDCCLLVIDLVLVVVRYLPNYEQNDQLSMYKNFVAYFVPFGLPAKSLCEIICLSLCAGLLIDRIVYEKCRTARRIIKFSSAQKTIVSIVVVGIIFKLPNFFLLKIVENYTDPFPTVISVKWTFLAKSWILMFNSAIFLVVYITLVCSFVGLVYLSINNHSIPRLSFKKRYEISPDERIFRRDRLYLVIGLLIGTVTMVLQIPHMLQSLLLSFGPINHDNDRRYILIVANMWVDMTNMILAVIKPVLYLVIVVYLRQALKDMLGLWIRPSHYSELYVSGGMGKVIDLRNNLETIKICRSDTTDTLLKCCNSDKLIEPNEIGNDSKNCLMIEALAKEQILKSNSFYFSFPESYVGSTASFFSYNNSESQSSNAKSNDQ